MGHGDCKASSGVLLCELSREVSGIVLTSNTINTNASLCGETLVKVFRGTSKRFEVQNVARPMFLSQFVCCCGLHDS